MRVKKVLLVDDSPTDQLVVIRILASQNFDILTASNGEEGIEKAKRELPDCILMDVVMPGINGLQAARALAKDPTTKDIPVIMLTAKSTMGDMDHAFNRRADGYITKPFDGKKLVETIKKKMERINDRSFAVGR